MLSMKYWTATVLRWLKNSEQIVSMNNRNLGYIYPSNARKHYKLADDKLQTKRHLQSQGCDVVRTYAVYQHFYELTDLHNHLKGYESFVIKPAQGSGGQGIIVVVGRKEGGFVTAGGKFLTHKEIQKHIGNIIFGVYSLGMNDSAIVEAFLLGHEQMRELNTEGLCDVRLIYYKGQPVQAMLRVATKASDGKANLHQGGIGIAVDIRSGLTMFAQMKRVDISHHPDTGIALTGKQLPMWSEVLTLCEKVAKSMPLKYLGIDVALAADAPYILEVNARPGIEIQNVNHQGMKKVLEAVS